MLRPQRALPLSKATPAGSRPRTTRRCSRSSRNDAPTSQPSGFERSWDLVRDIRALDERLAAIAEQMTTALDQHASSLTEVDGIGPVLGVRLIGRTGPAARFP